MMIALGIDVYFRSPFEPTSLPPLLLSCKGLLVIWGVLHQPFPYRLAAPMAAISAGYTQSFGGLILYQIALDTQFSPPTVMGKILKNRVFLKNIRLTIKQIKV